MIQPSQPTQIELALQDIQLKTIERVETTLKNLGAEYEIVFNGQTYTNFKRKHAPKRIDLFKPYNVKERLASMEPGQHLVFNVADGDATPSELVSNISAHASRIHGTGKVNCVQVEGQVLVARHE